MIGPGQPDKTSGPPGPVDFTKQPARSERIFYWAGPGGPFRALIFSETGRILDARRQQLNPDSLDSLVFLRNFR
jgi:hypothetical protein